MMHSVKEKLTEAKDRASEKFQEVKNKSKEKSLKTQNQTKENTTVSELYLLIEWQDLLLHSHIGMWTRF